MQFAPGIITIDQNYKPPAQLQIDKTSRSQAIEIYYRHPRVFRTEVLPSEFFSCIGTCLWKIKHSFPNASKIEELRLDCGPPYFVHLVLNSLPDFETELRPGALRLKVKWWSFEKSEWQEEWMSSQEALAQRDREVV